MTKDDSCNFVSDNKAISGRCKKLFPYVIGGDFEKIIKDGWAPRNGMDNISLMPPIRWHHSDDNACFNLHAWRFMSASWAFYIKNPTEETALQVLHFNIKIMMDWHENHKIYDAKFAWYDMGVAFRAFHLAFLNYLINSYGFKIDNKCIELIELLVKSHVSWLSNEDNITDGNHALYEIIALRILEYSTCSSENLDFCYRKFRELLKTSFDSNSVNTENSPFYHQYNLDILDRVDLDILPDVKDEVAEIKEKGSEVSKWLTAPSKEFYRIGDTEGDGALLRAEDLRADQQVEFGGRFYVFNDLGESGYQIVRSHPDCDTHKAFSFVFRGGPKKNTHRHSDGLSFVCFYDAVELFSDPGKFTFNYNEDKVWVISDVSHNTVGMHDLPLKPNHIPLGSVRLDSLQLNSDGFIFSGTEDKPGPFHHIRTVALNPGVGFSITDKVVNRGRSETEVRFIIGSDVFFNKVNDGEFNIHLESDLSVIATMRFSPCPINSIIITKSEEKSFVSKKYQEKTYVDQLLLMYPCGTLSVDTNVDFADGERSSGSFKHLNDFLSISSSLVGRRLRVFLDASPEFDELFSEYAFYVYVGGERKIVEWYQDSRVFAITMDAEDLSEDIKVRGFVRDKRAPGLRKSSEIIRPLIGFC